MKLNLISSINNCLWYEVIKNIICVLDVPYEDDIKKLGRTLKIYNIDGKSIFQDSDTYIGGKPKVWMGKFLVQNISNVYFLIDPISIAS